MAQINPHYLQLQDNYLFAKVAKLFQKAKTENPDIEYIDLGIGDITKPLCPAIVQAFKDAVDEMGHVDSVKGYSPANGYAFLKQLILENEYKNLPIDEDEIFIRPGTKDDIAHFQELFSLSSRIAIADPTYPVYFDSNVMAGRLSTEKELNREQIELLPCVEENGFFPSFPTSSCQMIYLCSPNNPTGVALNRKELTKWVAYAKKHQAILLFDGAYEAFIQTEDIPHSIFEIEGADEVAVEFRSFSKKAGFTGLRLSYVVLPKKVHGFFQTKAVSLHALWTRYMTTKFGGASYPIQKAAAASFSPEGKEQIASSLSDYMRGAHHLKKELLSTGYKVFGGVDAPYLFCKTPKHLTSMQFFTLLLEKGIVTIPGSGFGKCGEGYVRMSAFSPFDKVEKAANRIKRMDHVLQVG